MKEPYVNTGETLVIEQVIQEKKGITLVFSNGEKLLISENNYINNGYFYVGKEIDDEQLEKIKTYARLEVGRNYVTRLISRGQYTSREIIERLERIKHVSRNDADIIVSEFLKNELIDDRVFAVAYIEELKSKGLTKEACREKLNQRHLDPELVLELLEDYQEDEEALKKIIESCFNRYRNKPYRMRIQSVRNYLMMHEFGIERSNELINDYLDEAGGKDTEIEDDLLEKAADNYYRQINGRYDARQAKDKMLRHLIMKGFAYDDIMYLLKGDRYEFN